VQYTFTGITASELSSVLSPVRQETFQYTSPQFIVSMLGIELTELDLCVNCQVPPTLSCSLSQTTAARFVLTGLLFV
jgi:hypothetical protein